MAERRAAGKRGGIKGEADTADFEQPAVVAGAAGEVEVDHARYEALCLSVMRRAVPG